MTKKKRERERERVGANLRVCPLVVSHQSLAFSGFNRLSVLLCLSAVVLLCGLISKILIGVDNQKLKIINHKWRRAHFKNEASLNSLYMFNNKPISKRLFIETVAYV